MTLSLRGRLLIGVISLVFVGLLVADVATYTALQGFLVGRVDNQLRTGHNDAIIGLGGNPGGGPQPSTSLPAGTIVERVTAGETIVMARRLQFGNSTSNAVPVLPKTLPAASERNPALLTIEGTGGVSEYRAAFWPEDLFGGDYVVLAIPLTDVQTTLSQLVGLELQISLGVVAGIAILALVIIQVGLRPLRRMGAVAGDIAAGDLTRRVEPATSKTEIGRLGLALNAMLTQIEAAFAQRTASEQRLRRFIADASHELRTPLTSIRGYSEMLRRGASDSPADSDLARRRIEEESVRMSTLVDDMLLIARLDQRRPLEDHPVDLRTIAIDAASDARAVAPQREISLFVSQPAMVRGDDTRLRQVVGNLVRNALVHTPPKTPIEIGVMTQNGTARLTVTDHGPGLRADDRERIFEPFYRADPSRSRDSGGAGLGLSIVNAVVAAHGGRVDVKETSGGGATFEVELPLVSSSS
ncbi:MAG TPA: HAMP domain-containing sensor histidine kinase [Candidatus Dormibacteraeota bacterium]|nr:HAMP domain-containing sensor histidine kinase [Candidatus Dormibacteraeota bacterium]